MSRVHSPIPMFRYGPMQKAGGSGVSSGVVELYPQDNAASLNEENSTGVWTNNGSGTILSFADPYAGAVALRHFTFAIGAGISLDLNTYLNSGITYNISFWCKHSGSGGAYDYRLGATGTDNTGQLLKNITSVDTTYQEVVDSFTFGAANRYLLLRAQTSSGAAFIDLISITES